MPNQQPVQSRTNVSSAARAGSARGGPPLVLLPHLFPALPYHALATAHWRLARGLSDSSAYLETSRSSLWDALRRLWGDADLASQSA